MQYRTLERTGDQISVLGIGAPRLPRLEDGSIHVEKAKTIANMGIDAGINFIDSAYTYWNTQHFIGEHILPYREPHSVKVVGKLALHRFNNIDGYNDCLNEELRRYGIDSIDYYLLHMVNIDSFQRGVERGALTFLDAALADGRIRNVGVSIHDNGENVIKIIDAYDKWAYVQLEYNIIEATPDMERAMEYARSKGIGVMIMQPLLGGFLADKLPPSMQKIIDEAPVKRSNIEWALRFVYSNPAVVCVLCGMPEEQFMTENLKIFEKSQINCLTEEDQAVYTALRKAYEELHLIKCTGCRYCVSDCPVGIDIPYALRSLNTGVGLGEMYHTQYLYTLTVSDAGKRDDRWAKNCIQCGQCEQICPQHLKIIDALKQVAEVFEQDTDTAIENYKKIDTNVAMSAVNIK